MAIFELIIPLLLCDQHHPSWIDVYMRDMGGCRRLWWIRLKGGGTGERPILAYIIVCGRVGAVGGVGGPESQRRASIAIRGVNTVIGCNWGAG